MIIFASRNMSLLWQEKSVKRIDIFNKTSDKGGAGPAWN
jgi:hypothetical protein